MQVAAALGEFASRVREAGQYALPRFPGRQAQALRLRCLLAVIVFFTTGAVIRLGGAKGVGDALVGGISLPVDAVGVDLQQDGDAVPGPAGDLGGGHPGVQPQRHRRVPQVVGTPPQRRPVLGGGQGLLAGLGPDLVVAEVLQEAAPRCLEDPPVAGGAVLLDVGAQQLHEFRRDGDGAGLAGGAVLQAALLPRGAVVGPGRARPGRGCGQDDPPHSCLGRCRSASRSMTASDGRSAA